MHKWLWWYGEAPGMATGEDWDPVNGDGECTEEEEDAESDPEIPRIKNRAELQEFLEKIVNDEGGATPFFQHHEPFTKGRQYACKEEPQAPMTEEERQYPWNSAQALKFLLAQAYTLKQLMVICGKASLASLCSLLVGRGPDDDQ